MKSTITKEPNTGNTGGPMLIRDDTALKLTDGDMEVWGDFEKLLPRLKYHNLTHEIIIKATKIKIAGEENKVGPGTINNAPLLIDATAGLGEDSLLFAAAGFRVLMYERNQTIAALLRDAMDRGRENPQLSPIISRMELIEEDSVSALKKLSDMRAESIPDVIYLDPMFPERQKSGLVKKKMQLFQQLEQQADDEAELLEAATAARPRKIVIKRPLKGGFLAGHKPDYSIVGKAIRCDVIVFPDN